MRAAKPSELMYEVDEIYSSQVTEIVLSDLGSWHAGNGDTLPQMLLAMATTRLRLREIDRLHVRERHSSHTYLYCLKLSRSPFHPDPGHYNPRREGRGV